jgi:hypothetical protein
MDEKRDERTLVPYVEEAFAIVSLRNNYYAWLLAAKERLKGNLVTDYNKASQLREKVNINLSLVKREFDLKIARDDDEGVHKVVYKEGEDIYDDLKNETADNLAAVRQEVRQSQKYRDVIDALEQATGSYEDGRERKAKKRKVIKTFRQYTTPQQGESRFKGWSPRAAADMLAVKDKLIAMEGPMKLFSRGYRTVYRERSEPLTTGRQQDKTNKVPEETLKNLWGVEIERVPI